MLRKLSFGTTSKILCCRIIEQLTLLKQGTHSLRQIDYTFYTQLLTSGHLEQIFEWPRVIGLAFHS